MTDSLMLNTIHDDTWIVLNIQHINPNSKRFNYFDIAGGGTWKISKDQLTWLKVTTTSEKNPTPTYYALPSVHSKINIGLLYECN